MREKRILVALFAIGTVVSAQADIAATLLVNVGANDPGMATATAADYQAADADVSGAASVNVVSGTGVRHDAGAITALGLSGISFTSTKSDMFNFNHVSGKYLDTPIMDSGSMHNDALGGATQEFTISGFEEIDVGQTVTVTMYGVGSEDGHETAFTCEYNGFGLTPTHITYSSSDTYVTRTFIKVDGVDECKVVWGNGNGGVPGSLAGFSMTAIPEPSTLVLMGSLGGILLFLRRLGYFA